MAPGGTPRALIGRLNEELVRAIQLPDVRARLLDLGADIAADSPEQFAAFMKSDAAKWSKLLKEAGIRVE